MADDDRLSSRAAKKFAHINSIIIKQEIRARMKQVNGILKKREEDRTPEETQVLKQSPEIAVAVERRTKHRELAQQRIQEVEDPPDVLEEKCIKLAEAIRNSKNLVVYTGAGISTAASIPDYRGPNGVWTLLQKGVPIKAQDLSDAEPTFTHMSITALQKQRKVQHVVSQNCDGLHLRSGFPTDQLSEVHGNMYTELCTNCKPPRKYLRLFDVTERTGMRRHKTGRMCHVCDAELRDSIIHFGEKAPFTPPYNWEEAAEAAKEADLILCLGSSLKVLKKYGCLWNLHVPLSKRPQLFIVNLQWTPKDDAALLKINGKCDDVMRRVMRHLQYPVPSYSREDDPIFKLAMELFPVELKTTSKKFLVKCLEEEERDFKLALQTETDSKPAESKVPKPSLVTDFIKEETEPDEMVLSETVSADPTSVWPSIFVPVENSSLIVETCDADIENVDLMSSDLTSADTEGVKALLYKKIMERRQDDKPSYRYKMIKYLLDKPAEIADSQLKELSDKLSETSPVGDVGTTSSCSGLIYSNADSSRHLVTTALTQHLTCSEDTYAKSKYPTILNALQGCAKQAPICSVAEGHQGALTCSTGMTYQPLSNVSADSFTDSSPHTFYVVTVDGDQECVQLVATDNPTLVLHDLSSNTDVVNPWDVNSSLSQTSVDTGESHTDIDFEDAVVLGSEQFIETEVLVETAPEDMIVAENLTIENTFASMDTDENPSKEEVDLRDSYTSNLTLHICDPSLAQGQRSSGQSSGSCQQRHDESREMAELEQEENVSPTQCQAGSVPGWFGKGLNIKKRKKRLK